MAVITITLEQSPIQITSGIPTYVILAANIPSTIFYTLDGTEPSTSSDIYISNLEMPTDQSTVVLKVLATNGVDTSGVISYKFYPKRNNTRDPHDKIIGLCPQPLPGYDLFPFGSPSSKVPVAYGNIGAEIIDDPTKTEIGDGYDGTGTKTYANFTNRPAEDYVYAPVRSTSTKAGMLPPSIKIYVPPDRKLTGNQNQRLFNPKAMVIYHDGTKPPVDPDVSTLNRPTFTMPDNPEKDEAGVAFYTTAYEGNSATGFFIKSIYNDIDHTITFYYRDMRANRWIISKEPIRTNQQPQQLNQVVYPSSGGSPKVFKWLPYKGSYR